MPVKMPRLSRRRVSLAKNRVEPGGRGRGEMEMEALMPRQPGADFGMRVGGVIFNDQMHVLLSRGLAVDRIEKADELLIPWRLMHWPMTLPSRTLRAANRVVVPRGL